MFVVVHAKTVVSGKSRLRPTLYLSNEVLRIYFEAKIIQYISELAYNKFQEEEIKNRNIFFKNSRKSGKNK